MKDGKTINLENGATFYEMLDYLCSKVDWGKAALDGDAIVCMNTLFKELRKDKKIIKTG